MGLGELILVAIISGVAKDPCSRTLCSPFQLPPSRLSLARLVLDYALRLIEKYCHAVQPIAFVWQNESIVY
jgi:hypothetical protein